LLVRHIEEEREKGKEGRNRLGFFDLKFRQKRGEKPFLSVLSPLSPPLFL